MKRATAVIKRALAVIIAAVMTFGLVQPVMAAEAPAAGNTGAVMMESARAAEEAAEPDGGGGIYAGEELPAGPEASAGEEVGQDGSDAASEPGRKSWCRRSAP